MKLEQAKQRVIRFGQLYGRDALDLACHAAFPLAVTPDLLYCLRESFLMETSWLGVADVLMSPLCGVVGNELFEMDPVVRDLLLRRLATDRRFGETRLTELADFMAEYLRVQMQGTANDLGNPVELEWVALAYANREDVARLRQRIEEEIAKSDGHIREQIASFLTEQEDLLLAAGLEPLIADIQDQLDQKDEEDFRPWGIELQDDSFTVAKFVEDWADEVYEFEVIEFLEEAAPIEWERFEFEAADLEINETFKTYNIKNIENATFLTNSLDYQNLKQRVDEKREYLEFLHARGNMAKAIKANRELQQLLKQLEQLKEAVFRLDETFTKIEINTERLQQAKEYFELGQFREADAILKTEEINADLNKLLDREQQLQYEQATKAQIGNEFLIKARLWGTFYEEPDWFERCCEYFAESLRANRTAESLHEYAKFLQEHNQFKEALPLYEEALEIRRQLAVSNPQLHLSGVADSLSNLANLHRDLNEYETALGEYEEALEIRRQLAANDPQSYLPDVADSLSNLANLHRESNEYEIALGEYEEALEISEQLLGLRKQLAASNPQSYLPDVADSLSNLANLHRESNEYETALGEYEEALEIRRQLAASNPQFYLTDVADSLSNLANLHRESNEYETALEEYEEALEIRRQLAASNPQSYLPDVAMTMIELSVFYQKVIGDRQKSIAFAHEAFDILQPFEEIPRFQQYAMVAKQIIDDQE